MTTVQGSRAGGYLCPRPLISPSSQCELISTAGKGRVLLNSTSLVAQAWAARTTGRGQKVLNPTVSCARCHRDLSSRHMGPGGGLRLCASRSPDAGDRPLHSGLCRWPTDRGRPALPHPPPGGHPHYEATDGPLSKRSPEWATDVNKHGRTKLARRDYPQPEGDTCLSEPACSITDSFSALAKVF